MFFVASEACVQCLMFVQLHVDRVEGALVQCPGVGMIFSWCLLVHGFMYINTFFVFQRIP